MSVSKLRKESKITCGFNCYCAYVGRTTDHPPVDPWFNFRATKYLVQHGFYSFWDWFDDRELPSYPARIFTLDETGEWRDIEGVLAKRETG